MSDPTITTRMVTDAALSSDYRYAEGARVGPGGTANPNPGPDRPHLSERGSAVSIMLPPEPKHYAGPRGWTANDLTPADVAPLLERFITKFKPGADDECWLWAGSQFATGYGRLHRHHGLPALLAHRVSWVAFTGSALLSSLTIDHLCNVKLCINPAHLEPVTLAENIRRKDARLGNEPGGRGQRRKREIVACETCGNVMRRNSLGYHVRRQHPAVTS